MKLLKLWLMMAAGVQLVLPAMAVDNPGEVNRNDELESLKKQLLELTRKVEALEQQQATNRSQVQTEELTQQVRVLTQQRERDQEAAAAAAKNRPVVKLDANGFTCVSADTNFSISVHGLLQLDSRTFLQNAIPGDGGFVLRRARPILSGTVQHDFDYVFMPDFGGPGGSSSPVIQDAYVNYRYQPGLQIQAGKFKSPVGLEFLQPAGDYAFNELTLVKDLGPGRDLGVALHGDLLGGAISYNSGIFNGVADSSNASNGDFDNTKDVEGRLFLQPWKHAGIAALQGLGFGVGGTYGDQDGPSALGKYTTDGLQTFFAYASGVSGDGAHWRISPQGYYYYGPFGLMTEYIESSQKVSSGASTATLDNHAWEVTGSWVLTGEKNSYQGVVPDKAFSPVQGHWGAWELSARYSQLDVDPAAFPIYANPATSAGSAYAWSAGLSWWANKNIRVMTSFSRTTFSGGDNGAVTKEPEEVLFTRMQLAF